MTPHGTSGITYNTGNENNQLFKPQISYMQPCLSHDDNAMRPLILTSYVASVSASQPRTKPGILVELREAQEIIKIPGKFYYNTVHFKSKVRFMKIL